MAWLHQSAGRLFLFPLSDLRGSMCSNQFTDQGALWRGRLERGGPGVRFIGFAGVASVTLEARETPLPGLRVGASGWGWQIRPVTTGSLGRDLI